jgi:hypothetical protein
MRVLIVVLLGLLVGCSDDIPTFYGYGTIKKVVQYDSNQCVCKTIGITKRGYTDSRGRKWVPRYNYVYLECPCESVVGQTLITYPMGEEPKDTLKIN